MKKNILFKAIILIGVFITLSAVVSAAEPLSLKFSGPSGPAGGDFIGYVSRLYVFAVGVAGVFAVGMIVAGAIIYSTSGGGDRKREGINYITSALWGVALLLGSYLILKTVNPRLVELREPSIERLSPCTAATASGTPCTGNYSYSSAGTPAGQCPNASNTSCFFNPSAPSSTSACNFQNEDESCLSINKSTQACRVPSLSNFPRPGNAGCVCPNCTPLIGFPVTETACGGNISQQAGLGVCFLEESVKDKARVFVGIMSPFNWKITEGFPPINAHQTTCHYTGRCFDFSVQSPNFSSSEFCTRLK
ncbi:MAG: hypothetical protein AAB617_02245, partial [Patescibacteria group bacterium]